MHLVGRAVLTSVQGAAVPKGWMEIAGALLHCVQIWVCPCDRDGQADCLVRSENH